MVEKVNALAVRKRFDEFFAQRTKIQLFKCINKLQSESGNDIDFKFSEARHELYAIKSVHQGQVLPEPITVERLTRP